MPLLPVSSPLVIASDGDQAMPLAEGVRKALERLIELGIRVIDGHVEALLEIPCTLADVARGLEDVHSALEALPVSRRQALVPSLAAHAMRRKQLDLRELRTLIDVVTAADRPELVGRSVVTTALVLLSNLESDERWFSSLNARRHAA